MVRIGLIGSGYMAATHADRYRSIDGAEVAAVASPRTAGAFVDERGLDATAYADAETMLAGADLDAVDVCSPTATHRPMVEAAAERGLAVLCEKPLALALSDAEAIAETVETHGIPLMVGHVLRFFPDYRAIRDELAAGAVGEPGVVRARRLSPFPGWGSGNWFADDEESGGVFVDLAIHEFDFLRWAVGEIEAVFARRQTWGNRQNGHATLSFADGAVGYVEAGWDRPEGSALVSEFEAAGDEGLIEYDSTEPDPLVARTDAGDVEASGSDGSAGDTIERDGYHRELAAFVEAVESGAAPPVSVEEAVASMRVAVAANRSAERGEPVAIADVGVEP